MKISAYAIPGLKPASLTSTIDAAVEHAFGLSAAMLREPTRRREVVEARQTAMYFYRRLTTMSFAQIGALLGGKDHATVLHACRTVKALAETDKNFKIKFDTAKQRLL